MATGCTRWLSAFCLQITVMSLSPIRRSKRKHPPSAGTERAMWLLIFMVCKSTSEVQKVCWGAIRRCSGWFFDPILIANGAKLFLPMPLHRCNCKGVIRRM